MPIGLQKKTSSIRRSRKENKRVCARKASTVGSGGLCRNLAGRGVSTGTGHGRGGIGGILSDSNEGNGSRGVARQTDRRGLEEKTSSWPDRQTTGIPSWDILVSVTYMWRVEAGKW